MALIPRWQFMTDEAKNLVRSVGVLGVGLLLVMLVVVVLRTVSQLLLPLALVGVVVWLVFKFKR